MSAWEKDIEIEIENLKIKINEINNNLNENRSGILKRLEKLEKKPCMKITRVFTDKEITDILDVRLRVDHHIRRYNKELSELKNKVQENTGALSKYFSNLDGSDKKTWDEQIAFNRLEIKSLKEQVNSFQDDTLEEVNSNVELILKNKDVLRELYTNLRTLAVVKEWNHFRDLMKEGLDKLGGETSVAVETSHNGNGVQNNSSSILTDLKPPSLCPDCDHKLIKSGAKGFYICQSCMNPSEQELQHNIEFNKKLGKKIFEKDENPSENLSEREKTEVKLIKLYNQLEKERPPDATAKIITIFEEYDNGHTNEFDPKDYKVVETQDLWLILNALFDEIHNKPFKEIKYEIYLDFKRKYLKENKE